MPTTSQGEAGKPDKRDYWFEMLAVVLLGIATIGSAWCGYQASTWNGEESRQARNATDFRVEASRLFALGTQKVAYDATIAAQYADAYVSDRPELQRFYKQVLARPELKPILDEWDAKAAAGETSFGNLFDNEEYMLAQFGGYNAAEAEGNAATRLSAEAADNGDDYILTTLLMAAALFLAGVASSFGSRSARVVLVASSAMVLALAAARLVDLPIT